MTFFVGVGGALGGTLGIEACLPHVRCDHCGKVLFVAERRVAPAWLLNNKPPPGWMLVRRENADGSVYRRDYCRECKCLVKERDRERCRKTP